MRVPVRAGEERSLPALGSRWWKAPWFVENAQPFAGLRGNGGLSRFTRTKGIIQPFGTTNRRRSKGARGATEEGNFRPRRPAAADGVCVVLRSGVTRLVAVRRSRKTFLAASEVRGPGIAASEFGSNAIAFGVVLLGELGAPWQAASIGAVTTRGLCDLSSRGERSLLGKTSKEAQGHVRT